MEKRQRLINTLDGGNVDRLPVLDIIHNIDFIEHVTQEKITLKNAEDLTCKTVGKTLDLVRHFAVPNFTEPVTITDDEGFVYRKEWWTMELVRKPFHTLLEAREIMLRDTERIQRAAQEKKPCMEARENVMLFGDDCNSFEEVKTSFQRINRKLEGTVMIAPESVPGMYTALTRFGFDYLVYLLYDYPDIVKKYYDAICDYEVMRVNVFADFQLTPIALVSEAFAFNTNLIFPKEATEQLQYPRLRRVLEAWKKHGYYVIFHADGYKWPILDDIIAMGFDVIDPCESLAQMDISKFRQLYPNTTIGSVIDCQHLLAFGSCADVRKACRKAIKDSGGKRTILGSTSEIHPSVPVENAIAMYEEFGSYIL